MIAGFLAALVLAGGAHGIQWERDFDTALKKARQQRKPILVDFWAAWCGWCHRLDETTYVDATVAKLSRDFVAVKVDTEGSPRERAIAVRYDVSSLPTIAFLTPDGRQAIRLDGFQGPGQFPRTMKIALQAIERLSGFEETLERKPNDPEALAGLGVHLFEQESYDESVALLSKATQVDRGRPPLERKRTRLLVAIVHKYDRDYGEAESLLKQALEIEPAGEDDAKLLFVLGKTYAAWGRPAEARKSFCEVTTRFAGTAMAAKARQEAAPLGGCRK